MVVGGYSDLAMTVELIKLVDNWHLYITGIGFYLLQCSRG